MKHGDNLQINGETWKVLAVGATVGPRTYVHLASTTRGKRGRAGFIPAQECGWFDGTALHEAAE